MAANSAIPTAIRPDLRRPAFSNTWCRATSAIASRVHCRPGVGQARNKNSIEGHAPYSNFAPRLGFAWQPLSGGKLVVRGGVGIFYDRIGLDRVVHAFEQGYPYAATYDFGFLSPRWVGSSLAQPFVNIPLVCLPSDPGCNAEPNGLGFAPRFVDPDDGECPAPSPK